MPYRLDDAAINENVRGPQDLRAVLVTSPDPGVANEDRARALFEAVRLLSFIEVGRWPGQRMKLAANGQDVCSMRRALGGRGGGEVEQTRRSIV